MKRLTEAGPGPYAVLLPAAAAAAAGDSGLGETDFKWGTEVASGPDGP